MYLQHYGLDDFPFRLTPDTDYLYMSAAHSRALAYMEYAIFNREGFVVVTGEIGSGKTTLVKKLLGDLNENIVVAKIFQTQLDEVELLQAILVEFGLNPFTAKKVELLNMINQFLIDSYNQDKQVLLIIDDAQNLNKRVLEEITMLSGVETQKEKILHVILVGQPELNHKLEASDMEQLLQRISLRYHVRALADNEVKEYVLHRLKIAGLERELLDDSLYPKIIEYTGGIPRLINTLCDKILTCGYADNNDFLGLDDFENALNELQWRPYKDSNDTYKSEIRADDEDNLYQRDSSLEDSNSIDVNELKEMLLGSYSTISSRALVEISMQLKRIADYMENKK